MNWLNFARLSNKQYGLLFSTCTVDMLTLDTEFVYHNIGKYAKSRAMVLVITKAFDSVRHASLLHNFKGYGVSGKLFLMKIILSA